MESPGRVSDLIPECEAEAGGSLEVFGVFLSVAPVPTGPRPAAAPPRPALTAHAAPLRAAPTPQPARAAESPAAGTMALSGGAEPGRGWRAPGNRSGAPGLGCGSFPGLQGVSPLENGVFLKSAGGAAGGLCRTTFPRPAGV